MIAIIEEPVAIEKILKHIGLDLQPLPRARGEWIYFRGSGAEAKAVCRCRGDGLICATAMLGLVRGF